MRRFINSESEDKIRYEIPVTWQMQAVVPINSTSLEKAIQTIKRTQYKLPNVPNARFVDDSCEIDLDSYEE